MTVVGHSVDGRAIRAHEYGDPSASRTMLIVGVIHGNETAGLKVVRTSSSATATVCTTSTCGRSRPSTPTAWRPGRAATRTASTSTATGDTTGSRSRRRAVTTPVRNPFSEPETKAVKNLLKGVRPQVTVWYHQPFGRTLIPCDRRGRKVALRYARLSGLPPRDCYPSPPGAATGWQNAALHEKAFVAEFPAAGVTDAQARRHARALSRSRSQAPTSASGGSLARGATPAPFELKEACGARALRPDLASCACGVSLSPPSPC